MDAKIRLRKTYISALTRPQSSPSLSLLLISYLLGKCLGYARGEDRKARGGGRLVCYTAVFSVVTQSSSPLVGRSVA